MRLRQLTGLEQDKLRAEYEDVLKQIKYLNEVLSSEELQMKIIKDELIEINDKYGDKRRSEIVRNAEGLILKIFIPMMRWLLPFLTWVISNAPLTDFRRQNREDRIQGGTTRDEDFIEHLCCNNAQYNAVSPLKANATGSKFMKYLKVPEPPKEELCKI